MRSCFRQFVLVKPDQSRTLPVIKQMVYSCCWKASMLQLMWQSGASLDAASDDANAATCTAGSSINCRPAN